ncbi:uncharacterized protein FA14DRAFT_160212 [Meira miltonrushii]|uniref:Uncharacterized protein n=1 Tax=Meira miltonrushii TaxID=1280837 RepID=A0A316VB28_9BASI|nr:uncharacterized protein FA14DRAFT_160212 [Meira miltonrushii]PWN34732.1 hypothetical protein FA14DRAFT_160212 [Meira miltonrushii]
MSGTDKFQTQCLYAASHVAYEYCSEYAFAVEGGLRLANTHFKKQAIVGENVNQEEKDIILEFVRSSAANAIGFVDEERLQLHTEERFLHYREEKHYTYMPNITMISTPLDRRYHHFAKKVIESIFKEHQTIIEKGKMEALGSLYASQDREIKSAAKTLVSTIHEGCRTFRLSLFEIRREIESPMSAKPLEQHAVKSPKVEFSQVADKLFLRDEPEAVPEKRKHVEDPPVSASKKARQQNVQEYDRDDSSDDGFELTGIKQAAHPLLPKASSAIHSVHTTKSGTHPPPKPITASASSLSKPQTAPRPSATSSKRVLDPLRSTQSIALSKEKVSALQFPGPSGSSSTSVEKYGIDEILERGAVLFEELTKNARSRLTAILNHFKRAGFIQIVKAGLSSDAQKLIVAMMNGEDITPRCIRRIHDKGTQEGLISAMMLFVASDSKNRQDTKTLSAQETYKAFMTLTIQSQKLCISTLPRKLTAYNKSLFRFLRAEEPQKYEKLCIPIWILNDTLRRSILSEVTANLLRSFNDEEHLLREVAHLVRCALIVICWTTQDEELNARIKMMYRRGKPCGGLNDVFPIETNYCCGVGGGGGVWKDGTDSMNDNGNDVMKDSATDEFSKKAQMPTESSYARYEDSVKLLLGSGLQRELRFIKQTQRGIALGATIYLSSHARFSVYLTPEWLKGKKMKQDDIVSFKLVVGSKYHYSTDPIQTGAKLVMSKRNSDGEEQEHHILVSPGGATVIRGILLDLEKGKFR